MKYLVQYIYNAGYSTHITFSVLPQCKLSFILTHSLIPFDVILHPMMRLFEDELRLRETGILCAVEVHLNSALSPNNTLLRWCHTSAWTVLICEHRSSTFCSTPGRTSFSPVKYCLVDVIVSKNVRHSCLICYF